MIEDLTIYNRGAAAFRAGVSRDDNPYEDSMSFDHADWANGWTHESIKGRDRIDLPGGLHLRKSAGRWLLYSDCAFDHLATLTEAEAERYRVIAQSAASGGDDLTMGNTP